MCDSVKNYICLIDFVLSEVEIYLVGRSSIRLFDSTNAKLF